MAQDILAALKSISKDDLPLLCVFVTLCVLAVVCVKWMRGGGGLCVINSLSNNFQENKNFGNKYETQRSA